MKAPAAATQTNAADSSQMTADQKRVVRAATIGFFVDVIDIYLPSIVLAPAMSYFAPPSSTAATSTTMFYLVFVVTLLARPIGSVIFGHIADSVGRRQATAMAIPGVAICTTLIALLPGYAMWGIGAYVVLTLLRFIGGVFMGGATAGLTPLAMEVAPKAMRGRIGGFINIGYPLGGAVISLLTAAMLWLMPSHGSGSAYVQWGWRVPFVFGGLVAAAYVVYFRRVVAASPTWNAEGAGKRKTTKSPLAQLLRGSNRRSLLQVLVLMTGIWLGFYAITSASPGVLETYLGKSSSTVTYGLAIANLVLAAAYLLYAEIGQRIGRRTVLLVSGIVVGTIGAALYFWALHNARTGGSLILSMVLVGVCMTLATAVFPVAVTYITERFPTEVRSSGYAVGYSVAIVVPAMYSFYMLGLEHVMPYVYTPVLLVVIGGFVMAFGAWLGPQTNDVDLDATATEAPATADDRNVVEASLS